MNFLPEEIEKYSEIHTAEESEWLYNLNRETHQKILKPRMLSGHMQGRILSMFSHMIKPERILLHESLLTHLHVIPSLFHHNYCCMT